MSDLSEERKNEILEEERARFRAEQEEKAKKASEDDYRSQVRKELERQDELERDYRSNVRKQLRSKEEAQSRIRIEEEERHRVAKVSESSAADRSEPDFDLTGEEAPPPVAAPPVQVTPPVAQSPPTQQAATPVARAERRPRTDADIQRSRRKKRWVGLFLAIGGIVATGFGVRLGYLPGPIDSIVGKLTGRHEWTPPNGNLDALLAVEESAADEFAGSSDASAPSVAIEMSPPPRDAP